MLAIGFSGFGFALPAMAGANNVSWFQFKRSLPSSLWLAA